MLEIRAVRIYPMLLVGITGGILLGALGITNHEPNLKAIAQQVLFVPALRLGGAVYPYNNVQWSLGFEVAANIAHVILLRRLRLPALWLIVAAAGAALVFYGLHSHSLDLGMGISSLGGGAARVAFSYTLGLIIYRLHKAGKLSGMRHGWVAAIALLLFATCLPVTKGTAGGEVADLFSVMILLPLAVAVALRPIQAPRLANAFEVLGALSYPVYIVQDCFFNAFIGLRPKMGGYQPTVAALLIPVLLLFCWLALKWYDEPLRGWVRAKLRLRSSSVAFSAP